MNPDEATANLWYLADPPVGTYTVRIGLNTACVVAGAFTLYDVDLLDPLVDYATKSGTGGPVSLTLDSQQGDMGVDIVAIGGTSSLGPGSGQTERWDLTKT